MQPRQRNIVIVGMFAMLLCSATQAHVPPECEHLVSKYDRDSLRLAPKLVLLGVIIQQTILNESLDAKEMLVGTEEMLVDLESYILSSKVGTYIQKYPILLNSRLRSLF